jgi:integrase
MCSKAIVKQPPLLPHHLLELGNKFWHTTDHIDSQCLVMVFLGFYGFLRWSDLSKIRFKDITMFPTHAVIMLKTRKNDQCGKGSEVWISKLSQPFCPIALLQRFARKQNLIYRLSEESFVFRKARKYSTRLTDERLTYPQATLHFKALLQATPSHPDLSLHAMRIGGLNLARQSISDKAALGRHGGWRSAAGQAAYVRQQDSEMLSITRAMNIT